MALVFLLPQIERPHHSWVLAYLVEFDGSGGGGGRGAGAGDAHAGASSASAHDGAAAAMPQALHHAHHRAARAQAKPVALAARESAAINAAPASGDAPITASSKPVVPAASAGSIGAYGEVASVGVGGLGTHGGGGGGTGGGAGGGDGSGSGYAHVAYGRNPGPEYPVEARRRAEEGTVLLRIEVGADGSVERVEIAQSSGFESLDDSATETVRRRWQFVPALRDGTAVESWCMVPIRFALTEARAN